MATEQTDQGVGPRDESGPPVEDAGDSGTPPGGEQDPETFPREYVEELRAEAAEHRTKAKRAEDAETRLRELAIAQAVQGILTDPTDLGWSEEYGDAEGWPDPEKIKAAAEGLIDRKPHLARPTGDIGQGRHSEPGDTVSLVGLLGS